jgi:UDP-N-acetylmuramoyl-tripeptide--D-alanyl-D-alanine ligase
MPFDMGKKRMIIILFGLFLVALGGVTAVCMLTPSPLQVKESISSAAFPGWLKTRVDALTWRNQHRSGQLTRSILEQSLQLGQQFLMHNQQPAGNFNYQYDFIEKSLDRSDNQVRQAGALWGVALLYQHEQRAELRQTLDRGLAFFLKHSRPGSSAGLSFIAYPGDNRCETGTVALTALAIIEYLRTEKNGKVKLDPSYREQLTGQLDGYLRYLVSMQLPNRHFAQSYAWSGNRKSEKYSPYFDGETMLCLIKAAKYLGHDDLRPLIESAAPELTRYYSVDQWQQQPDSDLTKGFFQWSLMAFWEYQDAGWKDAQMFGDYVLTLAWWMIYEHHLSWRNKNTGYAYEGLCHAYALAKTRGLVAAQADLAATIEAGLFKLTSWQVDGPLAQSNRFLRKHPASNDPLARGGIMNAAGEAALRIDVTQHQMHALLLALRFLEL